MVSDGDVELWWWGWHLFVFCDQTLVALDVFDGLLLGDGS